MAGGWQSIWEKHHSMSASFLSPPKTTAEDVTGPCGTLRPYEPLVWDSTAVLVIAWESVTAVDPHTHTTPGLEAIDTRGGRGGHNPYIYLAPEPPRNTVLQPWMWHFRGNASSNCPSPSPNKLLHLMLDIKAALHSHRNFWDRLRREDPSQVSLGMFLGRSWRGKWDSSWLLCLQLCRIRGMTGSVRKERWIQPVRKLSVFQEPELHIPSAAESQSATCAGSDPGTT